MAHRGLLASLSQLIATLVAIIHTRLNLLSLDLEEDRTHLLLLFKLSLISLFCFGIGVILATMLIVTLFWVSNKILVLSLLTAGFLSLGFAVWAYARYKAKTKPQLFLSSLTELVKDWQSLTTELQGNQKNVGD